MRTTAISSDLCPPRPLASIALAFVVTLLGLGLGKPATAESPEATLISDLLRCVEGKPPSETWRLQRMVDGHLKANGRSANHGRMARAVQTCAAPNEKVGVQDLTAREWWAEIERLERTTFGHRYQEIGGGYESWSGLSEAFVVARTKDADHPAAVMLERELLLFAFAARPIEQRSRWRTIYRGYGRRVAGLRKLPWTWSFTPDSYLYARILGLPVAQPPVRRDATIELVDAVAPRVAAVFGGRLDVLRRLVLEPHTAAHNATELALRAKDLRSAQDYVVVRYTPTAAVFSALLGPLVGRNTAPTRAVYARGPRVEQTDFAYPFLDRNGQPRRRVRGRTDLDQGGGELLRADSGQLEFRTWNGQDSPKFMSLPDWVPAAPPVAEPKAHGGAAGEAASQRSRLPPPCDTVGIWLFPDQEPNIWIAPQCESS